MDFSKPVGVVFYFDGDYWRNDQSKVYDPSGELAQMVASAAAQNMLFVPVISPDTNRYDAGVTWWEDMERNGEFFQSLRIPPSSRLTVWTPPTCGPWATLVALSSSPTN